MTQPMTAQYFYDHCKKNGIVIERIGGTVLTLVKTFTAGSESGFADAESDVSIIYSVPMTSAGSTWGTDGLSVGGWDGLKKGCMRMHRSGCSKRFLGALKKLVDADARAN